MFQHFKSFTFYLCFFLAGCTRSCSSGPANWPPEKVVEGYLNTALNMSTPSQRVELINLTTGKLKDAISSASEEVIRKAYIERQYKLLSYSVIERRDRTPRETEITFQLVYRDLGVNRAAEQEAPLVTTENKVSLVKEKGTWLIREVLGAKTSMDFPVSDESKITVKPGTTSAPLEEEEVSAAEGENAAGGEQPSQVE